MSFVLTVVIAIVIIPLLKKLKVGQIEREDGPKSHLNKQGTPTMGGIIIILSITIFTVAVCIYYNAQGNIEIVKRLALLLVLSTGFGIVGFIDDFKKLVLKNTKGLSPSLKMLGLLIISVVYVLILVKWLNIGTELYIPFIKNPVAEIPIYVYIPFAILVMLATTNAVNLTDGVDGLSGSVCTIIITCLSIVGMILGVKEVTVFGAIVIGAILGFLMFNLHPAKIFMGDTGSLFLGGLISGLALYLNRPLILLIIAFIPVIETISVIMQVVYFKKTGNRIFKMAPLHHHFELSGWKENKVVVVFSIITVILCIIGLYSV
jgi:phospho-N-acetylmuramoyl-pentapeptide-transferase